MHKIEARAADRGSWYLPNPAHDWCKRMADSNWRPFCGSFFLACGQARLFYLLEAEIFAILLVLAR